MRSFIVKSSSRQLGVQAGGQGQACGLYSLTLTTSLTVYTHVYVYIIHVYMYMYTYIHVLYKYMYIYIFYTCVQGWLDKETDLSTYTPSMW